MDTGRVLIIEDDEWVSGVLAKLLRDRGHEVETCSEARTGFAKACVMNPDCIVCNVVLPDIDGFWVARRIRTEPSSVSVTPFLFLTDADDREARLQGLHVGADVYLAKPFTNDEAVAQVEALIGMARRLRVRRDSISMKAEPPSQAGAAFHGNLAQMSLPTVLMVLGMERRAGLLKVSTDGAQNAVLNVFADSFGDCELNGKSLPPVEVLRQVLRWKTGLFWFRARTLDGASTPRGSISALLLDAIRLEDEEKA